MRLSALYNILICILLALHLGCKKNGAVKDQDTLIEFVDCQTNTVDSHLFEILKESIRRKTLDASKFVILNLRKKKDYPSSLKDASVCGRWELNEDKITNIIIESKEITNHEWHYKFEHYPCYIEGDLYFKGEKYPFSINSGAWIDIGNKVDNIRLGYFKIDGDSLFLSVPWTKD